MELAHAAVPTTMITSPPSDPYVYGCAIRIAFYLSAQHESAATRPVAYSPTNPDSIRVTKSNDKDQKIKDPTGPDRQARQRPLYSLTIHDTRSRLQHRFTFSHFPTPPSSTARVRLYATRLTRY